YPMTLASQIAQIVMKVQQDVAVLVIKGDETLETIFPPKDQPAEWATFDEDLADAAPTDGDVVQLPVRDGERRTEGRFALFSEEPESPNTTATPTTSSTAPDAPEIVTEIDYESLTLAQLRARLTSLRISDL